MAPTKTGDNDNILPISNHDFFINSKCPMRAGNVRCRNRPTCCRVYYGDQSAPDKAAKLREQLIQQVKSLAAQGILPASQLWSDIETKVVMLMDWVLCQKHLVQRDAAVRMTMSFLKQDCGIFVEDQSAQLHMKQAAYNTQLPPKMSSTGPYSSYASAASHLATPPASPASTFQEQAHQHPFVFQASSVTKRGPPSAPVPRQPPQSSFDFGIDNPIKSEPITDFHTTQPQQLFNSLPMHNTAKENFSPNTRPLKPQQPPAGFHVRNPTSNGSTTNTQSAREPRAEVNKQQPPAGFTVRPHASHETSRARPAQSQASPSDTIRPSANDERLSPQPAKSQAPFGFKVREHDNEQRTTPQPAQPKTPRNKTAPPNKGLSTPPIVHKGAVRQTPRSPIDEMVDNLEAMRLSNEELTTRNKTLVDEKAKSEAKYRRAEDHNGDLEDEIEALQSRLSKSETQLGEMRDENQCLQSDLTTSNEKTEQLEQELAVLRRLFRVVS